MLERPRLPPSKEVVRIGVLCHLARCSAQCPREVRRLTDRTLRTPPQAGKLSTLYGSPIGPLGGAKGPQYGGHAVRSTQTPRSARAPVTTWWDKPVPPAPPPAPQSTLEESEGAKPARFQHTIQQPAIAYQASVLEERMLLAVSML